MSNFNKCVSLMCKYNITSKKDFLQWALKGGHPNKGGKTNVFAMLSNCNDNKIYCPLFVPLGKTKQQKKSPVKSPKKTPTKNKQPKKTRQSKKSSIKI